MASSRLLYCRLASSRLLYCRLASSRLLYCRLASFRPRLASSRPRLASSRRRSTVQGVKPPVLRTEEDFDPAAKYHVAADLPYTRWVTGSPTPGG